MSGDLECSKMACHVKKAFTICHSVNTDKRLSHDRLLFFLVSNPLRNQSQYLHISSQDVTRNSLMFCWFWIHECLCLRVSCLMENSLQKCLDFFDKSTVQGKKSWRGTTHCIKICRLCTPEPKRASASEAMGKSPCRLSTKNIDTIRSCFGFQMKEKWKTSMKKCE